MTRYLSIEDDDGSVPETDERDVTTLIPDAVDAVLAIAETWLAFDGSPVVRDGNAWTPHKALRRVADHLIDHLAEIECRLAGVPTEPDRWHGRRLTLDADFARFTEADLDEATSRLRRLALCYRSRLAGLPAATLDAPSAPASGAWTIRQIVHHVAGITAYAELLGPLA
ncbi:hypothetical protein Athai_32480 [Actinocatenispora thailandica]|uniref:DinB-like domain-containing protein n=1 Tax=Actinocatenispora thailandica TaxID=227318 RepID=A0A7R7DPZ7_9ACTN|nr:hypothetical protein [Actinocatenispora thailandica]BCJ35745.1 hypothetical protein Athai_32480 [Actinocatenispora thailandica]